MHVSLDKVFLSVETYQKKSSGEFENRRDDDGLLDRQRFSTDGSGKGIGDVVRTNTEGSKECSKGCKDYNPNVVLSPDLAINFVSLSLSSRYVEFGTFETFETS